MLILPTNNTQFKGTTKYLSCDSAGQHKRISECPYGTAVFGETKGLTDLIKKFAYPYANIEETIGNLHENRTNRVYYADPNEVIGDSIKLTHDYVVYDVEPDFPNIMEDYFSNGRKNIAKRFKELNEYFTRLRKAELKNNKPVKVNIREHLAELCSKIYTEGTDLRDKEEALSKAIQTMQEKICQIEQKSTEYKNELPKRKINVDKYQEKLTKREKVLDYWKNKIFTLREKPARTIEQVTEINKNIQTSKEQIQNLKYKIKTYTKRIEFLENYINQAPQKILECKEEIERCKVMIAETKEALLPNFKKLCTIYKKNGIKFVKRI